MSVAGAIAGVQMERASADGVEVLDDRALVARVLGSVGAVDAPESTAVAAALLKRFGHLPGLARAGSAELAASPGLSPAAATRLVAAFEAGRRALSPPWPKEAPFSEPEDVWAHYRATLGSLDREVFLAVGLDVRCRRVCEAEVAAGSLSSCAVEPRDVFLSMLRAAAHSVLLVHNHPSGDPTPSPQDRRLTSRLAMAGQILGIPVVDHVIVGRDGYHSLSEEGCLP